VAGSKKIETNAFSPYQTMPHQCQRACCNRGAIVGQGFGEATHEVETITTTIHKGRIGEVCADG
jgi:hypothetical protein